MKKLIASIILIMVILSFGTLPAVADVGDGMNGGGQILEGTGKDGLKISFGGFAVQTDVATYEGQFQINFHNVGDDLFDKAVFHGDEVIDMNFFPPTSDTCLSAMNMKVLGTLDGEPGFSVVVRFGDAGPPGHWTEQAFDTFRVTLQQGNASLYDTHGDFTDESTCVGTARTGVDRGNLTIDY